MYKGSPAPYLELWLLEVACVGRNMCVGRCLAGLLCWTLAASSQFTNLLALLRQHSPPPPSLPFILVAYTLSSSQSLDSFL